MTPQEIRDAIAASPALTGLSAQKDWVAISASLSNGRKKLVPTEIGSGTVLATLGAIGVSGGTFLDTLVAVGAQNRDVYWTMDLIKQGRLRIDNAATRAGLSGLALGIPSLAPAVNALLTLGYADDPVTGIEVEQAVGLVPVSTWAGVVTATELRNGMVYASITYTSNIEGVQPRSEQSFAVDLTPGRLTEIIAARVDALQKADSAQAMFA